MLYYSAIGYESVILADCTVGTEGSLMSVASQHLLSVISRQSTIGVLKDSRVYGEYRLHCLIKDSIVAITITEAAYSVEQSYKFLEDVHKRFNASDSLVARSHSASELQLNYEFRPVLKQLMTQYSKSSGKITGVNAKVEEVKQVMLDNIDKAIERGDRLESLEERTTQLSHESSSFRATSRKVRQKYFWQNMKLWVALIAVLAIIIVFAVVFGVCHPDFSNCGNK